MVQSTFMGVHFRVCAVCYDSYFMLVNVCTADSAALYLRHWTPPLHDLLKNMISPFTLGPSGSGSNAAKSIWSRHPLSPSLQKEEYQGGPAPAGPTCIFPSSKQNQLGAQQKSDCSCSPTHLDTPTGHLERVHGVFVWRSVWRSASDKHRSTKEGQCKERTESLRLRMGDHALPTTRSRSRQSKRPTRAPELATLRGRGRPYRNGRETQSQVNFRMLLLR